MFKIQGLDKTDIQLLNIIQNNPEYGTKQIAGLLNKSETAVYGRIRTLKQKGIISPAFIIDSKKFQHILTFFTQVKLNEHSAAALTMFKEMAITYEEVAECYHMTGVYDFNLKIIVPDMVIYDQFLSTKLSKIPNVGAVESYLVIAEHKHDTVLKLV